MSLDNNSLDSYHRVLELYSGIGGMHCAWSASGLKGEVVAAIDINTVANEVYKFNFPETNLLNSNIQSVTPKQIMELKVNTILMSPPCQPFTRNGKYLDNNDNRTNSFIHIINILDQLNGINYILMENVKGFECSTVRNLFVEKLKDCNFNYQEFLICPSTIGIPNSRCRYYCVAKRKTLSWQFIKKDDIMQSLPGVYDEPYCIKDILQSADVEKFLLQDKHLKRGNILDICHEDSRKSCCFTKAYSHYMEGTGSVFTASNKDTVDSLYKKANIVKVGSDEFVSILKKLKLRFFTPNEILLLMCFPKNYEFPNTVTIKQCYRLLGNSVNVKVISELLKILFDE